MLWTEGERREFPEDTEEITPADETAEIESSDESEDERDDADDTEYGESRYTRKSRHLPRIEDEGDASSVGTGLRDAIIGSNNKRGGGSA
jgi:hypothetical protein